MNEKENKNGVFISRIQVSRIVAFLILIGVMIFISGYFLGKRNVIKDFSNMVIEGSYIDDMKYSISQEDNKPMIKKEIVEEKSNEKEDKSPVVVNNDGEYYAQLIGFGTLKAAEKFEQMLKGKNTTTDTGKEVNGGAGEDRDRVLISVFGGNHWQGVICRVGRRKDLG